MMTSFCSKVCQTGLAAKLENFCKNPAAACDAIPAVHFIEKSACNAAIKSKALTDMCDKLSGGASGCTTSCTTAINNICTKELGNLNGCKQGDICAASICAELMKV